MLALKKQPKRVIIRLPTPHDGGQDMFYSWNEYYPKARCLIAPCGTKVGKTFGSSLWMVKEALVNPGSYCAWIAPTYLKCRIAYRYIKSMLPNCEYFNPIDGRLEIALANGSFIKFLHGKESEVTIEGEGIDRFVIDEAGKVTRQVWVSLLTTITQTRGLGIVTGTPRGFTWYYDLHKQALAGGDDFFAHVQLKTAASPFVTKESIGQAKRLLPSHLFRQYYEAEFVTHGSTFGDLSNMWDLTLKSDSRAERQWVHPDANERSGSVVHGVDIAQHVDYTVFYSVNSIGKLVGYYRFRHCPYTAQIIRLKTYLTAAFGTADNHIRYDATGVGVAFGDMLADSDVDATITPVTFTNKAKAEMITKTTMALQLGWHKAPLIKKIEQEFSTYELTVTPSGLYKYSAPDGETDDIVSAAILAISGAYESSLSEDTEKFIESTLTGGKGDYSHVDLLAAYADLATDQPFEPFADDIDSDDNFVFDPEAD